MKYVWIIVLFGIVGTGGYLAMNNSQTQVDGQATAGVDGTGTEPQDISKLTGIAKIIAKLKNAFDGKSTPNEEAVAVNASRDLGRLGGHFRSAPAVSE